MKYTSAIFLSLLTISVNAQNKKVVVVTVDDLPVVYYVKADLLH